MVAPADRLSRERPVRRTQATPRAPPGVQASGECRLRGAHGRCDYPPEAIAIRRSGLSLGGVQATEVVNVQRCSWSGRQNGDQDQCCCRAPTVRPSLLERIDQQRSNGGMI